MVWTIPNTFTGGTPANANEMNENFTSIKQFVDVLETQGANNEIDISTLTTNKADINGSTEQRFSVANPVSSMDAMNLQTFQNLTLNSRNVINGLVLSKSNNNTISATAGYCYDSTYEYMISSASNLTKSETLGANTTYYVFICADAQGSNPQLVFTTSSTTPTLPSGYDYYRRIGSFKTNDDSQISTVNSESSPSFVSGEQLSGNGYIRLANGLTIQWGSLSITQGTFNVTLPVAFTSNFFCVTCSSSYVYGQGTDRQRGLIGASPSGLTSFQIVTASGNTSPWTAYWIAIGV